MTEQWNGKGSWVEMFKEIGLSEEQMHLWHQLFERRYPEQHEAFLRWLGVGDDAIAAIRERFGG